MTNTHIWKSPEIFVFGSNLLGMHHGGAALFAKEHCGAIEGIGQGLVNSSYALPTCYRPGEPITLDILEAAAKIFVTLLDIPEYEHTKFFLTAVGTGIAGFTHLQVAPLFIDDDLSLYGNMVYPPEWLELYKQIWKKESPKNYLTRTTLHI